MTQEQINDILDSHKLWLEGKCGQRANLRGANLKDAYLEGANLIGASVYKATQIDDNQIRYFTRCKVYEQGNWVQFYKSNMFRERHSELVRALYLVE